MAFIARTGCGGLCKTENYSWISYSCSHQDAIGCPGHQVSAAGSGKGLRGVLQLWLLLMPLSIKAGRVGGVFMLCSWPKASNLCQTLPLVLITQLLCSSTGCFGGHSWCVFGVQWPVPEVGAGSGNRACTFFWETHSIIQGTVIPVFWIELLDITPHNGKSMLKLRTQTASTQGKIHTKLCYFIMFAWTVAWQGCGLGGQCAPGIQVQQCRKPDEAEHAHSEQLGCSLLWLRVVVVTLRS